MTELTRTYILMYVRTYVHTSIQTYIHPYIQSYSHAWLNSHTPVNTISTCAPSYRVGWCSYKSEYSSNDILCYDTGKVSEWFVRCSAIRRNVAFDFSTLGRNSGQVSDRAVTDDLLHVTCWFCHWIYINIYGSCLVWVVMLKEIWIWFLYTFPSLSVQWMNSVLKTAKHNCFQFYVMLAIEILGILFN